MGTPGHHLLAGVVVAVASATAFAERPAIRTYTVADGLAGDQVLSLARDRDGFLWIGTHTGLSRFDGSGFLSYSPTAGLPVDGVWGVVEGPDRRLRCVVGGTLYELPGDPAAGSGFVAVDGAPSRIGPLVVDHDGGWWLGAGEQLWHARPQTPSRFERFAIGVGRQPSTRPCFVTALAAARADGVWVGTSCGAIRVTAAGLVARYPVFVTHTPGAVQAVLEDTLGRVWLAGPRLVVMRPDPVRSPDGLDLDQRSLPAAGSGGIDLPATPGEVRSIDARAGLPRGRPFALGETADGAIWVATHEGLAIVRPERLEVWSRADGLVSDHLGALLVDPDGNRWLGTQSHGLMRINATGFTSYTEADGLADRQLAAIVTGPDDSIVAVSLPRDGVVNVLRGDRFVPVRIPYPPGWEGTGWGLNFVTFFDHLGALWVPTDRGLLRFPPVSDPVDVAHLTPAARYSAADGLGGETVFRLWEDSRDDLWIGLLDRPGVVRWRRDDNLFEHLEPGGSLPPSTATAFGEDTAGNVWIGFYRGGLARFAGGGEISVTATVDLAGGFVNCLLTDSRGRLWVGSSRGGLAWSDAPAAGRPTWQRLGVADGLAAEGVYSLAEDRLGRLWIGTLKGLDRLDPDSGRIDHFDTSTGLVNNLVLDALTGPDGDVWFATDGGVSRVRPRAAVSRSPPPVLLDRIVVDGTVRASSLRGVAAPAPLDIAAGAHNVEIHFSAVDMVPGSQVGFGWTLDGGPVQQLGRSEPRVLRLAGLAAGRHEIGIRAALPDGTAGPAAELTLAIAPPFWRRWWFLATVVALVAAAAVTAHRVRLARLHELHRVRGRISADLHDEMGLSLARVAMLADVTRGGLAGDPSPVADALEEIGGSARALVDSASDMAWALDPRHDSASAVMARLRQQAADVAEGAGARLEWQVEDLEGLAMSSEHRRHLLLILKEAVHNACRHARPRRVTVSAARSARGLRLTVEDDGRGFQPAAAADTGQGLASMRRRASALGGTLEVCSVPGDGTRIVLDMPLHPGRMDMLSRRAHQRATLGTRERR